MEEKKVCKHQGEFGAVEKVLWCHTSVFAPYFEIQQRKCLSCFETCRVQSKIFTKRTGPEEYLRLYETTTCGHTLFKIGNVAPIFLGDKDPLWLEDYFRKKGSFDALCGYEAIGTCCDDQCNSQFPLQLKTCYLEFPMKQGQLNNHAVHCERWKIISDHRSPPV